MKGSNTLLSLAVLVKRNIKLYLRDKMNVFFSVLAPIIVLLLYILFLSEMQVNSIMSMPEFAASGLTRGDIQALINNWMISGVMGVSCITVAINANVCMVRDKQNGIVNDMLSSPIKRWVIFASYIISAFLITFCICIIVFLVSLIYLACSGGFFLTFVDVLAIFGITILTCISSAFFVVLICGAIKTVSSLSAVNGVFGTIIGFVIGAYLPFSMIPKGIQYMGCFVPGTYSTGLFKNYFMKGVVGNLIGKIPPESNIVELLKSQFSLELDFFGMKVSAGWMVLAVLISIIIFGGLILILYTNKKTNFFSSDKKRKKKATEKSGSVKKTRNWVGNLFMWPFKIFPIKGNRIYFMARYGQQYNCNPRAFFEYLYQNHYDEFEFVWCLNKKDKDLPKDVKRTRYLSLRDLYYIHTSKFIINNNNSGMLFAKRKKQVYVMTGHGGAFAYKKVEGDQNLPFFTLWNAKIDAQQRDVLVAASKQEKEVYEKAFFATGKTYLTGNPRCDRFINKNPIQMKEIRARLNLLEDDFVVLYSPTFRENQPFIQLDNEMIRTVLEKETGKHVKILYTFHPRWSERNIKEVKFDEDVINATSYPEFQDLVLIADMLITDFSSCMFDIMMTGKLCILNRSEAERYLANERGVYISTEKLPFPIANNEKELRCIMENLDETMRDYKEKCDKFCAELGCIEDGHSCERMYDLMMTLANEKGKKRSQK